MLFLKSAILVASAAVTLVSAYSQAPFMHHNDKQKFIVVLKESLSEMEALLHFEWLAANLHLDHSSFIRQDDIYHINKFRGYAGIFSDELLERIMSQQEVDYVQEDRLLSLADEAPSSVPQLPHRKFRPHLSKVLMSPRKSPAMDKKPFFMEQDPFFSKVRQLFLKDSEGPIGIKNVEYNAPWNLARLGEQHVSQGNTYFQYDSRGGNDAVVFIMDTGINIYHSEFGGRAFYGYNAVPTEGPQDLHSHGTHVAGTVGGATYGVAKSTYLVSVKVLGASGTGPESQMLAGFNWLAHVSVAPRRPVINYSITEQVISSALNSAVQNIVNLGFTIVCAAGNTGSDSCQTSPVSSGVCISVAASDNSDTMPGWSNFGSCVSIIAPGVNIVSASNADNTSTLVKSGTSMASPHLAGTVALMYGGSLSMNAAAIRQDLQSKAVRGVISSVPGGTPNLFVQVPPSR